MKYELIENSNAGVIIDPTPVLRDIKDTFEVSFLLPHAGAYIALFRGEDGVEHKAVIKDSAVQIPKELLGKEQRVGLTVCFIDGDTVVHAWECHPLKVGAFLYLRQTQWQITAALTDAELYARLAEIERGDAETRAAFDALKRDYTAHRTETAQLVADFKLKLYEQGERLASVKNANETLTAAYNKAITVVNDLTQRVAAIEKNYDPTVIK